MKRFHLVFSLSVFLFLASGYSRAATETPNLSDFLSGRLKLNNVPAETWQLKLIEEKYPSALSIPNWREMESGYDKAQLLGILWHRKYNEISAKNEPVNSHYNKAFGLYLRDSLLISDASGKELPIMDSAIFAIADLALLAKNKSPFLEMLGDVLLMKEGGDYCYLAAAAYQLASAGIKDEMTRVSWERKALFAMEKRIINPAFFDKTRETRFLNALKEEAGMGKIEISFPAFHQNPQFWPSGKTAFYSFVESQLKIDRSEDRKLVPSREITLPGVNPKEIKRNVTYNIYAIFILLALAVSVWVLYSKFKKATEIQELEDAGK